MNWSDIISKGIPDEDFHASYEAEINQLPDGRFEREPAYDPALLDSDAKAEDIFDLRIPTLYATEAPQWVEFVATGAFCFGESVKAHNGQVDETAEQSPSSVDKPDGFANWYMLPAIVDGFHAVQLVGRQNIQHLGLRFMSQTFDTLADLAEKDPNVKEGLTKIISDDDFRETFEALVKDSCVVKNRPKMLWQKAPNLFPFQCDKQRIK